jgi:hypothetical protein
MNESVNAADTPRPKRGLRFGLQAAFVVMCLVAAFIAGRATMHGELTRLRQEAEAQRALAEQERQARNEAEAAKQAAELARRRLETAREQLLKDVAKGATKPKDPDAVAAETPADKETSNQDERFRRLVVGTWQDDYQGKRTMTLREDGTGTMVVELEGVKAILFAPRLQFEMDWSVERGRLKKRTLRGEPAAQVQLILKTMGDRVDEPILELTEGRLLLLDKDGQTKYDWRRVP